MFVTFENFEYNVMEQRTMLRLAVDFDRVAWSKFSSRSGCALLDDFAAQFVLVAGFAYFVVNRFERVVMQHHVMPCVALFYVTYQFC